MRSIKVCEEFYFYIIQAVLDSQKFQFMWQDPLLANSTHTKSIQPTQNQFTPHIFNSTHTNSIQPTQIQFNPHKFNLTHTNSIQPTLEIVGE